MRSSTSVIFFRYLLLSQLTGDVSEIYPRTLLWQSKLFFIHWREWHPSSNCFPQFKIMCGGLRFGSHLHLWGYLSKETIGHFNFISLFLNSGCKNYCFLFVGMIQGSAVDTNPRFSTSLLYLIMIPFYSAFLCLIWYLFLLVRFLRC